MAWVEQTWRSEGNAAKEEMRQQLLEIRDDSKSEMNSARAVWQFVNKTKMSDAVFVREDFNSKLSVNITMCHIVWSPVRTIIVKELI